MNWNFIQRFHDTVDNFILFCNLGYCAGDIDDFDEVCFAYTEESDCKAHGRCEWRFGTSKKKLVACCIKNKGQLTNI